MTSVFDWRGPATVVVPDTSNKAHKRGKPNGIMEQKLGCSWSRSVAKCDLHGRIIKVYPSCAAAARDSDVWPQAINAVLNGKAKTAGGFKWQPYNKPMGARNDREDA